MKFDLEECIKDRNDALFSFDMQKILTYFVKYDIQLPEDPRVFWGSVAKAVLGITNAPEEAKVRARKILDELGMSYETW